MPGDVLPFGVDPADLHSKHRDIRDNIAAAVVPVLNTVNGSAKSDHGPAYDLVGRCVLVGKGHRGAARREERGRKIDRVANGDAGEFILDLAQPGHKCGIAGSVAAAQVRCLRVVRRCRAPVNPRQQVAGMVAVGKTRDNDTGAGGIAWQARPAVEIKFGQR